jgi:hypothetical protein
MKIKFSFLVALAAALVAGCAAYYSVFGLSQLFAGASTAVIIMASSLEFSKVVAVSFLHRYWNKISVGLKTYLTIGVFVLICITSGGIYGFLSNAYQKTANKLEISEGQLSVLDNKKGLFQKNINDNQNIINSKSNRVTQLTNLRTTQETRLDAAANNGDKSRARKDISSADKEIQKLNGEIDTLNAKNTALMDSVNLYSTKSIESKSNNSVTSEIGPLKYLAQLTGYPMDKVVNWFILLLIFVFDPLAVSLVIATNKVLEIEGGKKEEDRPSVEPKPKKERTFFKKIGRSIANRAESFKSKASKVFEKKEKPVKSEIKVEQVITTQKPIVENVPVPEEVNVRPNTNRGFSSDIPAPSSNIIERIGSNKIVKDNNTDKVFFKRRP